MLKSVIAVVAAVGVTSLAFYGYSSRNAEKVRAAHEAERAAWQVSLGDLEKSLANARRPSYVSTAPLAPGETQFVTNSVSPEAVLQELIKIRATTRDPSIRRVIFRMEQLRDLGVPSLPVIAAYLEKFEDVDYLGAREEGDSRDDRERRFPGIGRGGDRGGDRGPGGSGRRSLSFITPPSLRIGLFDVVQGIGGEEAEKILVKTLESTGRAVEVAYLAKVLNEMAPNKHATLAANVAKDLLLNPQPGAAGDRLDENAKEYLYGVLATANDASFAPTAQTLIVTADGRIDRTALNYVHQTLKEQAMPAIMAAYNDPRITNQWEKASLLNMALNYAGPNQQANEMLNSIVSNDSLPAQARTLALMQLTRGEPTPEMLRARLPVVEALKGSTQDERMQRSLDVTYQNIQAMLAGQPVDDSSWRAAFAGRGGDRPGGDRGQMNRQGQPQGRGRGQ